MKNFRIEFRWALIISLFTVIWYYFEKWLGFHHEYIGKEDLFNLLIYIPIAFLYYLEMRDKRKFYYKGYISWQQATLTGGILSALIAVISPLVQYIFKEYISPEFFQTAINHAVEAGRMKRSGAQSLFNYKTFIIQAVFDTLAYGVVISALVALIVKREPEQKA